MNPKQLTSLFLPMHPAIAASLWCQAGLFVISVLALPFDKRTILGLNPWIKPIKFELSVSIFLLTIAMLLAQRYAVDNLAKPGTGWTLATSAVAWMTGLAMIAENVLIAMQAARGVRSHMNFTTAFDSSVFGVMAAGVLVNTLALALLLLLYLQPGIRWPWPTAVNAGARLGLAILIWGSLEGVAMVTRMQHTVGGPDSGAGLPFLNWSTQHGDLRVAHFFAIHAIHFLMLFGFLLSRVPMRSFAQSTLMVLIAAAYLWFCYVLFRNAVQGRPFLAAATTASEPYR